MYCAFGDESRDGNNRFYAVACVFGCRDEWGAISIRWQELMAGKIFHAADLEAGFGDFRGVPETDRAKLYRDLVQTLVNSRLVGHGDAVDIGDYQAAFPHDFKHSPYLWAFRPLIESMAELAASSILGGSLAEITFDNNREIEHNAKTLYKFMLRSRQTRHRDRLPSEISFARRENVGIQIADLYARETMMQALGPRVRRESFAALRETRRFQFKRTNRADFERSKARLAERSLEQAEMGAYHRWLSNKRMQDCQTNRIVYMEQFTSQFELDPER
jgi:hypothetical protein